MQDEIRKQSVFVNSMVDTGTDRADRILNGWKEIANYLHCGIRTVQRWESNLRLPVRPRGKSRSAVLALTLELDLWLKSCPARVNHNGSSKLRVSSATPDPELQDEIRMSRELRAAVRKSGEHLKVVASQLLANITKLHSEVGAIRASTAQVGHSFTSETDERSSCEPGIAA